MATKDSSGEQSRSTATEKKPYEKPGFRYEQVFVTSALACTKTIGEGQCGFGSTKVS